MRIVAVLVLLICICGCSPQKSLVHQLKGADRVVVTNTIEHLSISVTGDDVNGILKALDSGKKQSPKIDAAVGLKLEFYEGVKHLGSITTSGQVFWVGNTPYSDPTETIVSLYRRLREETDERKP